MGCRVYPFITCPQICNLSYYTPSWNFYWNETGFVFRTYLEWLLGELLIYTHYNHKMNCFLLVWMWWNKYNGWLLSLRELGAKVENTKNIGVNDVYMMVTLCASGTTKAAEILLPWYYHIPSMVSPTLWTSLNLLIQ